MYKSLYKIALVNWLVFNWNTKEKKNIPVEDRGGGAADDDTKKEKYCWGIFHSTKPGKCIILLIEELLCWFIFTWNNDQQTYMYM